MKCKPVKDIAGEYGFVEQTLHRWKKRYGGIFKTEEGEAVTQADIKAMQKQPYSPKRRNNMHGFAFEAKYLLQRFKAKTYQDTSQQR